MGREDLHFTTFKNDSVVIVEKWGFYHCDSSNPILSFNDGNTLVNLDKVGAIYFISGNSGRCNKGQRMIVKVNDLHQIPPSIATPPYNPYYAISPSPTQLRSLGPSSHSGLAVSVSASVMALIFGLAGLGLCLMQP